MRKTNAVRTVFYFMYNRAPEHGELLHFYDLIRWRKYEVPILQ